MLKDPYFKMHNENCCPKAMEYGMKVGGAYGTGCPMMQKQNWECPMAQNYYNPMHSPYSMSGTSENYMMEKPFMDGYMMEDMRCPMYSDASPMIMPMPIIIDMDED